MFVPHVRPFHGSLLFLEESPNPVMAPDACIVWSQDTFSSLAHVTQAHVLGSDDTALLLDLEQG